MVTLAITIIAGAIISATAFSGTNYLVRKYLPVGDNNEEIEEETKRHDLALEKYESDYDKNQENKEKFEKWEYEQ